MRKDQLYKKASELFEKFEDIEKTIGEYTVPQGCRLYKREKYWEIWKPIEETSLGKKLEILFVSDIDDYVTDKSRVLELFQELENIYDEVMKIARQLGEEGVSLYKEFIFHYYYPYKPELLDCEFS